ncbi:MAG: hypothetical protein ACI9BW_000654 [Gammaproteobacteria bacterium]|jgi:hypothetical protein
MNTALSQRALVFACLSSMMCASFAAPLPIAEVPEPLKPWVKWVVADDQQRNCPSLYNSFKAKRCAWPSILQMRLDEQRGEFRADWQVFTDSWIALPGEAKHWPQNVTVDGVAHPVIERNGKPSVHVAQGRWVIKGEFRWNELPKSLAIPVDAGIVDLQVRGEPVPFPNINRSGQIWLGDASVADERIENSQSLKVARRVIDETPMQIETRIDLDVTGQQRELVVGKPLLDGFIPISINSPLPARIEPNGELRVQVRAGRHAIVVLARHPGSVQQLTAPTQTSPWPRNEIWAFDARNDLRLVKVEGVTAVDPSRTQAPAQWRHLPIYSLTSGTTMRLNVIRRGNPEPEPDKYNLSRQIWLDFDGGGFTTQDHISGTVSRRWRLDSRPELRLGQVVVDGQPRFISLRESDAAAHGVELRRARVDIVAEARLDRSAEISATGWAQDFQSARATLNIPPGWDVFFVDGVDNIPNTWIARWSLLDLFLVLVIAVTALRLWNPVFGGVTVVMLVLTWHAPDAPRYIWLMLFTLIALLKVLPAGVLRRVVNGLHGITAIVLIAITVPFAVHECRLAFYPQLEFPYRQFAAPEHQAMAPASIEMMEDTAHFDAPAPSADEAPVAMELSSAMSTRKLASKSRVAGARAAAEPVALDLFALDPSAVIQTGPGLPQWQWKTLSLDWNGPVQQEQKISVTFIPPALSALIHLLRVVMIAVLLWLLFGTGTRQLLKLGGRSAALLLLAGTLGLALPTSQVQAADFPDKNLLETLRQRLNAPPDCGDRCADITRMRLDVNATTMRFRLQVNSSSASAIPLPGSAQQWLPQSVLVDGVPSMAMARDHSGTLWVTVPAGVHEIVGAGVLPPRTNVQITLLLRPHAIELSVDGWTIEGVREDGQVEPLLQLTRVGDDNDTKKIAVFETNQLPPFIRIERSLRLGLDWTLTTTVRRLASGNQAAVIAVPLILGEAVVTPGIEVSNGVVNVNLGPRTQQQAWQSVIPKTESFALVAPQTSEWLETWRVQTSPMWHLEYSGIAPVHEKSSGAEWIPQWRAWPGESVSFTVTKPSASPGQSLTIDSSRLTLNPGKRATDSHLSLQIRSSKGGQYSLGLPPDIELQAVRINGSAQALQLEDGELTIPVIPGAQNVEIQWRHNQGIRPRFDSAAIDLSTRSINHEVEINLGEDRWTLFAFGPRLGPAVRFWSLFAILIVVALVLSRLSCTPLTTTQWLLLAIGLSQVSVPLAAIVVLWLVALGVRERHGAELKNYRFNLTQIGLVLLTVAAMLVLVEAIRHGLLGNPDMHVAGNGSSSHQLRWYADRILQETPPVTVLSVPILVYRLLMLAWALWLALAIVSWVRWAWNCLGAGGLWQPWRKAKTVSA